MVCVQRQYSGTAGTVENCQVAAYMTRTRSARTRVDRPVLVPAEVPDRRTLGEVLATPAGRCRHHNGELTDAAKTVGHNLKKPDPRL